MSDQLQQPTEQQPPTTPQGQQYQAQANVVQQPQGYPTQQPVVQPHVQPFTQPAVDPTQVQSQVQTPTPVDVDVNSLIGSTPLETSLNIFTASSGVKAERFVEAMQSALQYDDINLINKEALTQGLSKEKAAQAEALATAMFQHAKVERAAVQQQAYTAAGGEEQWNAAIQAFNTQADADTKEYAQYLESQGKTDKAIKYIMQFVQGSGLINSQEGTLVTPSGGTPNSAVALSGAEFQKAVGELYTKAGNALHSPHSPYAKELQQLQHRRELGKRQGL